MMPFRERSQKQLFYLSIGLCLTLTISCAGSSFKHQGFEGPYIEQADFDDIEVDQMRGQRERRAIDGQPHTGSSLATFGGFGLVPAVALKHYLDGLVVKIVEAVDQPDYEVPSIEVFVTAEQQYTAYATPYADIFVSAGVLDEVQFESELAFILAHEVAHILLDHFDRDSVNASRDRAVTMAAGAAAVTLALVNAKTTKDASGNQTLGLNNKSQVARNLAITAASYVVLNEVSHSVFDPHGFRDQEDEADLLALDLMDRAGFTHGSAIAVLDKLKELDRQREEARIKREQDFMDAKKSTFSEAVMNLDLQQTMNTSLEVAVSKAGDFVTTARNSIREDHKSAEYRAAALRDYYGREYRRISTATADESDHDASEPPTADNDPPAVSAAREPLEEHIRSGITKRILENHKHAHAALSELQRGDFKEAERLGKLGISSPTSEAPFPRYVMYQIRKGQNDPRALKNLQKVEGSSYASPIVIQAVADEYIQLGRTRDALRVLDGASERLATRTPFLSNYVAVHVHARDEKNLNAVIRECRDAGKDVSARCEQRRDAEKAARDASSNTS